MEVFMLQYGGTVWLPSDSTSIGCDVSIGSWNSSTAGYGKRLYYNSSTDSKTKVLDVLADDAGAVLPVGQAFRASRARMLLTAVHTGDVSIFGNQRHIKVTSNISGVTGHVAGGWDYLECSSTATVGGAASGGYSMIDLPTSAVIAASSVISAHKFCSNTLGGTHTGKAAVLKFATPVAGAFDFGLCVGTNAGYAASTASIGTSVGRIAVCDEAGTALGYIPVVTY
jgi:hypothetical protein